jgi:hypothetical protein
MYAEVLFYAMTGKNACLFKIRGPIWPVNQTILAVNLSEDQNLLPHQEIDVSDKAENHHNQRDTRVLQIVTVASMMGDVIPFPYRLFFLYVEPISALAGAYYAAIHPSEYLLDLVSPIQSDFSRAPLDTPTSMTLFQLSNLYLLFALNEHLVLSSTSSLKTWRRLLFSLLVADFGHLATMIPAGTEIFGNVSKWNAMAWGSVGFVYLGASLRLCFLAGVGLERDERRATEHSLNSNKEVSKVGKAE